MTIRKATEADIEILVQLRIKQLYDEGYTPQKYGLENIAREMTRYFRENIRTERYISWVAVEAETIVAISGLCFYDLPPSFINLTGKVAYLTSMYTMPAYRRRGLAAILVRKMIEIAREKGYTVMRLHASEAGRPLYRKLGFVDSGTDMILKIDTGA